MDPVTCLTRTDWRAWVWRTLEERRMRGDLTETHKIMTGKEAVDRGQFFQLLARGYNVRQHSATRNSASVDVRKFFCSQRVLKR